MTRNEVVTSKLLMMLGAAIIGAVVYCSDCNRKVTDSRYDFKGRLGNEEVEVRREHTKSLIYYEDLYLTVTREDGKTITYLDTFSNLILDEVKVNNEVYVRDAVGEQAVELAQQQFDDYLTKILEYKKQKAIDDLTKGE